MEDTMTNTILKELRELKTENNKRWEENEKRWQENNELFKKIIYAHEKRLNFYYERLKHLEEWKDKFDMGEYTTV